MTGRGTHHLAEARVPLERARLRLRIGWSGQGRFAQWAAQNNRFSTASGPFLLLRAADATSVAILSAALRRRQVSSPPAITRLSGDTPTAAGLRTMAVKASKCSGSTFSLRRTQVAHPGDPSVGSAQSSCAGRRASAKIRQGGLPGLSRLAEAFCRGALLVLRTCRKTTMRGSRS